MKYLDSFILTFSDNSEPVIGKVQREGKYVTAPVQWLHDLTKGRAQFKGIAKDGIEIVIPIADFLEMKDTPYFQSRCTTLVRLRTSPYRSFLGALCYPVSQIDNRI